MFLLEHQDRQTDTHTLHNFIRKQKDLGFHVEQWHYKTIDKLKLYKVKKKKKLPIKISQLYQKIKQVPLSINSKQPIFL